MESYLGKLLRVMIRLEFEYGEAINLSTEKGFWNATDLEANTMMAVERALQQARGDA